jgi:subtilisin-like proprotein convertase family protein
MKKYFQNNKWPWYALSGFCLLLGCVLLFRSRQGCADVYRLNLQLATLDNTMTNCCRCSANRIGVIGPNNPIGHGGNDELVGTDERVSVEEIGERRDNAGGQTGELAVTLSWNNTDDLDLSIIEPDGSVINHSSRVSLNGGQLDVDQNYQNETSTPIENVFWSNAPQGTYRVKISLYKRNQSQSSQRIPVTLQIVRNGESELQTFYVNGAPRTVVHSFNFQYH